MRIIFIIALLFTQYAFAQSPNTWDSIADFSGQRDRAVGFSIDNYGYVGCGEDTANIIHNDIWRYDPINDVWSQMANIPGSVRRNAVAFTIDSLGYVGTGVDNTSAPMGSKLKDFWKYSPSTNSWGQIADYPGSGVYFATAFSSSTRGYVCGGKIGPDSYVDDIWEYKPSTDLWAKRSDFPGGGRYQMAGFCIGDKIFVGLGADQDIYRKDWWEYDIATNTWEQKGDFPASERGGGISFNIRTQGFVALGSDGGFKKDLWEYNQYNDTWLTRNDYPKSGRKFAASFVIGDTVYVGIGKGSTGKKRSFMKYFRAEPLAINKSSEIEFNVYPNPVADYFTIKSTSSNYDEIKVFQLNGNEVFSQNRNENGTYHLDKLTTSGVYFVSLISNNNILVTRKIVVSK